MKPFTETAVVYPDGTKVVRKTLPNGVVVDTLV